MCPSFLTAAQRRDLEAESLPPVEYPPTLVIETVLESLEITAEQELGLPSHTLREVANTRANQWEKHLPMVGGNPRGRDIKECSSRFIVYSADEEIGIHPMRCKRRECPICADIRRKAWYHRSAEALKLWTAPKHITLTLKSSDAPLDDQLKRLLSCFRRLRQREMWKRRSPWGIWTIEITYNAKTGLWHPHIHIIANMQYIPREVLREAWYEITGDSFMVGIQAVKSDIARYIAKYIAKGSTVYDAPVDIGLVSQALKGKRLANKIGKWPPISQPEKPVYHRIGSIAYIARMASKGSNFHWWLLKWLMAEHPRAVAMEVQRFRRDFVIPDFEPPSSP